MELLENIEGDELKTLHVSLSGRMTFNDHKEMRRITRFVVDARIHEVIFDLSSLDLIDSAAIGMLLIVSAELQNIGGSARLENAKGQVERILKVAKVHELISYSRPKPHEPASVDL